MIIEDKMKTVELPKIYKREGKNCYYDTYRKKLIEITPEETVRQKVAALLERDYGVPKEMIWLEVPMSYYNNGSSGRADIIIHEMDEGQNLYPITVIECKNENVFLTDKVVEQAISYCNIIGAKYIIVTNGIYIKMAVCDIDSNCYVYLDKLLAYDEMLDRDYELPKQEKHEFVRFNIQEIKNQNLIWQYNDSDIWIFGSDTEERLRSFAINLYQCFLDTEHKLPLVKRKTFELIQDIGQRYMDYTNAGGGHYNGIYRAFLVKDKLEETQIVSMSIFGTDANFRGENRRSYTSLIVSIDRFKTSHNSLQYNVDRFAQIIGDEIQFIHNGQIGNYKSADVVDIVERNRCGLCVKLDTIYLGKVNMEKLFYLDDDEVSEFVYNLIEYALLREELRRMKKKKV